MSLENAISALSGQLNTVLSRLENIEAKIASGASASAPSGGSSSGSSDGGSSPSVQEYQALIDQFITPFVESARAIGDATVTKQAELVADATNKQRQFLEVASKSKKPDDTTFQKLLAPTSEAIGAITAIKDSKEGRTSKLSNNLSTVAEGIAALGWVCVSPTPGPHVADMRGGSEFYSNRILKEFKGNNQTQVDFVTHFNGFLKELQNYIKKNHTTGVSWNPRGGDAGSATASTSSAPSAPSGPPPPPAPTGAPAPSSGKPAGDMNSVFAALSKGEGVTSGLKKVTNDMKSKNNPNKSSVVPATAAPAAAPKAVAGAKTAVTKPPKFALEGTKWVVEFQKDNKNLVIDQTESRHTVYIYKCSGSVVVIKGKVNAITLGKSFLCLYFRFL